MALALPRVPLASPTTNRAASSSRIRANMPTEYQSVNALHGRLYYSDSPPIKDTGPFCGRGDRVSETGILRLPLPAEQVIDLCSAKRTRRSRVPRQPSVTKLKRMLSNSALPERSTERSNSSASSNSPSLKSTSSNSSGSGASSPDMSTDRHTPRPESASRRERPALSDETRSSSGNSVANAPAQLAGATYLPQEKPLASGNGVAISIALAEPFIYLQGFEQQDISSSKTTMLRGILIVRVSKPSKLKSISLRFRGRATTDWPEGSFSVDDTSCIHADLTGIPPRKSEFKDVETLLNHTWTFFNCQFANGDSHCADSVQPLKGPRTTTTEISQDGEFPLRSRQESVISLKDARRLSMQHGRSRSLGKGETVSVASTKGYRIFTPGEYLYSFEMPIDSRMPESISVDLGNVKYDLEATVERAGAFRANLQGTKEVTLIRSPAESSLEMVEPIAISRDWEDQLHYDIVISGKSFPLGSQIPIAFKLTPLAKVQCHRIKVYVTENVQYFTSNKRVHRLEPTRKIQLFEKRADGVSTSAFPGSTVRVVSGGGVAYDHRAAAASGDENVDRDMTNLLGNLEGEHNVGPTEMELNVQLPSCCQMEKERAGRIHFDTTYSNIQVNHWIKIVLRLSRPDANDAAKRRHFEISIDSPFNILSCRATQANTSLPAYSMPDPSQTFVEQTVCGCPGASRLQQRQAHSGLAHTATTNGSSTPSPRESSVDLSRQDSGDSVPVNNAPRPMHLLRQPSFNPPAWSDDDPPPPLITPPPKYESEADGDPLEDYFARLAEAMDRNELPMTPGRVEVPLTPGGRTNRSMDEQRTWLPRGGTAVV